MASKPLMIFDCDGVLVDSEPISLAVLREALAGLGVFVTDAQSQDLFLGRSLATMIAVVQRDFGATVGPDFLENLRQRLYQRFRAELRPIAGIAETWSELQSSGIDWCVASSSQPERIKLSLEITGLIPRFSPPVYSATMVKNGKPAPDLFLHAARKMGRVPADCIVLEDSPAGIEAAKAAKMRVFAFTGGGHARSEDYRGMISALKPDLMFDAMRDLVHLVKTSCEERE